MQFFKLFSELCYPALERADAGIVVAVDLAQAFELGFGCDQFAGHPARSLQRRFAHGLNIDGAVLARELRQLVGRVVEILFGDFEALLEKHTLAMRGRDRELSDERIQLVNVGLGQIRRTLWTMIRYADADDAALAIFRDDGALVEDGARILFQALAIHLLQIELLDQPYLGRIAAQNFHKQRARIV